MKSIEDLKLSRKHLGKWVAWDENGKIVATSKTVGDSQVGSGIVAKCEKLKAEGVLNDYRFANVRKNNLAPTLYEKILRLGSR